MFKRLVPCAALALLLAASAAPAQFSTGYYGGGDYRTLYSFFPDRLPQWPGAPDFYRPLARGTIVYYPPTQTIILPPPNAPVTIDVIVPDNAELWIEGQKMKQDGGQRHFISPPLEPNRQFSYDFRIRYKEAGREQTKTRNLDVVAGGQYTVDFVNPPKAPGRIQEFTTPRKELSEEK